MQDLEERGREMKMEDDGEETGLVDGCSERERGVLNNKWYIGLGTGDGPRLD
jgi:hypothetical protein